MSMTVRHAHSLAAALLQAVGLSEANAETSARCIVLADCWGIESHGLLRLPYYLQRCLAGGCPPDAHMRPVNDTGPLFVADGGAGLGHWQLWSAAETAAARAADYGIAAAAVGNSGHCGALGVYTIPALRRGLVAVVFSHGPAVMPPWGASEPLLSTSPLAAGFPCGPGRAIVDMASSAVARGKIAAYAQRGEPLPLGWALDAEGRPTENPVDALRGLLSPLGGAKGYALAFLVEALTAALVGPSLSADVPDMFAPEDASSPQRLGHLVIALDPDRFDGDGGARRRLEDLAARAEAAGGRVPGTLREFPEEIPDDRELEVPAKLEGVLRSWCDRLHLTFDQR